MLQTKEVPEGVDPTRKEYYLEAEDFKSALGVSLEEYDSMPQWKKDTLKKKALLF